MAKNIKLSRYQLKGLAVAGDLTDNPGACWSVYSSRVITSLFTSPEPPRRVTRPEFVASSSGASSEAFSHHFITSIVFGGHLFCIFQVFIKQNMHFIVAGEFMVYTIFYNPTVFKKVDNAIRCFILN